MKRNGEVIPSLYVVVHLSSRAAKELNSKGCGGYLLMFYHKQAFSIKFLLLISFYLTVSG